MASFIFGGNTNETAESLARKREIAKALLEGATGRAPQNIGEGLTAVGQAIAGRAIERRAMRGQEEGRQKATEAFRSLLGGSTSGSATASMSPTMSAPASSAGANPYRDAIASIESQGSGDYAAVGPTHPELGRALGRYQVMEANIGPWSQEALGREVSAEEFMANPQLQDAIFDHQFGKYVQQYGPEGAAQAWFGGPGGVGKTNRQDSLGTSIGEYTNKFNAALGDQPAAQAIDQNFGVPVGLATGNQLNGPPMQRAGPAPTSQLGPPTLSDPYDAQWNSGARRAFADRIPTPAQQPAPLSPQAFTERFTGQPAPDPMPTASTPPADPLRAQLQAFDPQSQQLAKADPSQGILRALLSGGRPAQGEFPPAPGSSPSQAGPMGLDPRLIELASNPFFPPEMRAVVGSMIEQQMQSADPMRQMEMERARLELEQLRNPQGEAFTLGEGQRRYDASGNLIAEGAPDVDAPTVQTLKLADGSEMAVQWDGDAGQWVPINAPVGGGDITPRSKLTENQSKLTLFQTLQTETQPVLLDLESQFNPANIADAAARSTPIAGNFFQSEQGQIYQAASTAWAEGALRIATGAAATPEEMERTKRAYFAQPGDTPITVAFKAQMREMYNRAIDRALGSTEETGTLPKPSDFMRQFNEAPASGKGSRAPGPVVIDGFTIEEVE